jgi:hypothetical protein
MFTVTTPPRVHRTQLDAALRRIAHRHAKVDDERFASIDSESAGQVLDYIVGHRSRYPWVTQADICDGLVLWVWQWWEGQRQLHSLLTRGQREQVPLKQLGTPLGLGINSRRSNRGVRNQRQGTLHRIDRLTALLDYDRPDADLARAARRAEREAEQSLGPQLAWLVRHRSLLVAVADRLLAVKRFANDDAYAWLVEVASDRNEDEWSPGSITVMKLAVEELRAMPEVVMLPSQHLVKRACHAVDELAAVFSTLSEPNMAFVGNMQ